MRISTAKVWSDIQTKRWGSILTGGTILAGDGLVIEIELAVIIIITVIVMTVIAICIAIIIT